MANIKTYDIHIVIAMPAVVQREGQPDIPITSAIVAASMEGMLRDNGVDLLATQVQEVNAIDDEDSPEDPASHL